jgi:probable rRNA maturation factor
MIKTNIIKEVELENLDIKKIIKKITKKINKVEKIKGKHTISFIIVDSNKIWEINKEYRKIDSPTDVISFAAIDDSIDGSIPEEMGDIFICKERVLSQANEYGHSILREFAFLCTHGVYHLLGYDHQNEEEEKIMFEKQEKILKDLKIER